MRSDDPEPDDDEPQEKSGCGFVAFAFGVVLLAMWL